MFTVLHSLSWFEINSRLNKCLLEIQALVRWVEQLVLILRDKNSIFKKKVIHFKGFFSLVSRDWLRLNFHRSVISCWASLGLALNQVPFSCGRSWSIPRRPQNVAIVVRNSLGECRASQNNSLLRLERDSALSQVYFGSRKREYWSLTILFVKHTYFKGTGHVW